MCSFSNMAVARITRLRPCLIPARRNSVRRVLLNGSRADAEFGRYFFVAAALNQQLQDLLVTAGNFDLVQVQHCSASSFCWNADTF